MSKIKTNKFVLFTLLLSVFLLTTGIKCGGPPEGFVAGKPEPVTLNYWKVWEASTDITDLILQYQASHSHVNINFRNFTYDEFEIELLNALAEDRGPDIISIHTTWMGQYLPKLQPLPTQITIPYETVVGSIKKETFTEFRTENTLGLRGVKTLYPDVVFENQVINNQIYGLPLSIDTLALFYNRDLLNNVGIASPPLTWDDFKDQVIKLTRLDQKGNILQSGAAFGTANNIDRASDILSLLMMQNNVPMTNTAGLATFNRITPGDNIDYNPAVQALDFYNGFASPAKQVYTWDANQPNSLQAFMSGETAFYFGYSYNIPTIKAQSKINFDIAEVPQGRIQTNFANYWVETVSNKSQHVDEAWSFLLFIATNTEANKAYLDKTRRPTALRDNIAEQLNDLELAPFANQLLTAKSWYKGKDASKVEEIFESMITDNLLGATETERIIDLGVQKVNATY